MKNKEKILKIINLNSCGISVKEILIKLDFKINKTTVYRNLEKLIEENLILEEFSNNGEKLYLVKNNHHHHFICDKCGKKINIGCFISPEILKLENKFGFKVKNHSFLLNGICKDCI